MDLKSSQIQPIKTILVNSNVLVKKSSIIVVHAFHLPEIARIINGIAAGY